MPIIEQQKTKGNTKNHVCFRK